MFCSKCGNQLDDGVRFCSKCGAAIGETPKTNSYGGGKPIFTSDTGEMMSFAPDTLWLSRAGKTQLASAAFMLISAIMFAAYGGFSGVMLLEVLAICFTAYICLSSIQYKGALLAVGLGIYSISYYIYRITVYNASPIGIFLIIGTFGICILTVLRILRNRRIAIAIEGISMGIAFILMFIFLAEYGQYFSYMPAAYNFLIFALVAGALLYYVSLLLISLAFTDK